MSTATPSQLKQVVVERPITTLGLVAIRPDLPGPVRVDRSERDLCRRPPGSVSSSSASGTDTTSLGGCHQLGVLVGAPPSSRYVVGVFPAHTHGSVDAAVDPHPSTDPDPNRKP
jgi:hypothetical protein